MITYNEFYKDSDIAMINKIHAECETQNKRPSEMGWYGAEPLAEQVLTGTYQGDPSKLLAKLFNECFSGVGFNDVHNDTTNYADSFSERDKGLSYRIRMRVNSPRAVQQNITVRSIAQHLNRSDGLVSQLIKGSYKAQPTEYLQAIWEYLETKESIWNDNIKATVAANAPDIKKRQEKNKQINLTYGEVDFVETSISKIIISTINKAKAQKRFSMFSGDAGLGKTMAIRHYAENDTNAIVITGCKRTDSNQILRKLADKLNIHQGSKNMMNLRLSIIKQLMGRDKVIIVDEADKCTDSAFDELKQISDDAFTGISLIGNQRLNTKILEEDDLELIKSRMCWWLPPHSETTVEDIKKLWQHFVIDKGGYIPIAKETDEFWIYLHKRLGGSARALVENFLPHALRLYSVDRQPVDIQFVNSLCNSVVAV